MLRAVTIAAVMGGLAFSSVVTNKADMWRQTDWSGGPGQAMWADSTMYYQGKYIDGVSARGDLTLEYPAWFNTGELPGAEQVNALIEGSDGAIYAGTQGTSGNDTGKVFKTTNHGDVWTATGELPGAIDVEGLLEDSGGYLYAATACVSDTAAVFKSGDWGGTWLRTGSLAGAVMAKPLLEGSNGAVYVGTYSNGDVFESTDGGSTWVNTGELAGALGVFSLIESGDSSFYAGTGALGRLFKSTDLATTWTSIWEPPGATFVAGLLETSDGSLYAGTSPTGQIYRSTNAGQTWVPTGELTTAVAVPVIMESPDSILYAGTACSADGPQMVAAVFKSTDSGAAWVRTGDLAGAGYVWSLLSCTDGFLYAGTSPNGDVFRSGYSDSGYLVSSVYETGPFGADYETMLWSETTNGQTICMKVRTSPDSAMAVATPWDSCPLATNGQDISSLLSVNDGDRYVQYRAELLTSDPTVTPVLHLVEISYSPRVGIEEPSTVTRPVLRAQLGQNQPNPFALSTTIQYAVPQSDRGRNCVHVFLGVYDVAGRLVRTLVKAERAPGRYLSVWDATDGPGKQLSTGVYFCRLSVDDCVLTRKMAFVR